MVIHSRLPWLLSSYPPGCTIPSFRVFFFYNPFLPLRMYVVVESILCSYASSYGFHAGTTRSRGLIETWSPANFNASGDVTAQQQQLNAAGTQKRESRSCRNKGLPINLPDRTQQPHAQPVALGTIRLWKGRRECFPGQVSDSLPVLGRSYLYR